MNSVLSPLFTARKLSPSVRSMFTEALTCQPPNRGGMNFKGMAAARPHAPPPESVVVAGAELIVVGEADAEVDRHRHGDRVLGLIEEGQAGCDPELQAHSFVGAGIGLPLDLEGQQRVGVQRKGPQQLAVVVAKAEGQLLHGLEAIVGAHVRRVDDGGAQVLEQELPPSMPVGPPCKLFQLPTVSPSALSGPRFSRTLKVISPYGCRIQPESACRMPRK